MARQSLLAPAWPDRSCLRLHGQDLLAAGGGTRGPRAELEASRKEVDSLRKEVSILQVGVRARARVCVCVCVCACLSVCSGCGALLHTSNAPESAEPRLPPFPSSLASHGTALRSQRDLCLCPLGASAAASTLAVKPGPVRCVL